MEQTKENKTNYTLGIFFVIVFAGIIAISFVEPLMMIMGIGGMLLITKL